MRASGSGVNQGLWDQQTVCVQSIKGCGISRLCVYRFKDYICVHRGPGSFVC